MSENLDLQQASNLLLLFGDSTPAKAGVSTLAPNAVAYYRMEEASGTRVDSTGRGNDLTAVNGPGNVAGRVGNACRLVLASTQSLTHAESADFLIGMSDFTFAGWFYPDDEAATRPILSKQNSYTWSYNVANGFLELKVFYNAGGNIANAQGAAPTAAAWNFVVGWRDTAANTINVQVNNGAVASAAFSGATAVDTGAGSAFNFGVMPGVNTLLGNLDEFGIWKRVLTAGEKTALYNGGLGVTY